MVSVSVVDPVIVQMRKAFAVSGKTLEEVGLAMGLPKKVARKSVWQLLNKVVDPRVSTLRKFAMAVGVSLHSLTVN